MFNYENRQMAVNLILPLPISKCLQVSTMFASLTAGLIKNDSFSFYLSIAVLLAGLTKPDEVGEILALYRLKSLSLDYKAKLKSPCFFLQVTLFLQIIFVLW